MLKCEQACSLTRDPMVTSTPSNRLPRVLEIGANLSIILTSIILIVLAVGYWESSRGTHLKSSQVGPGDSLASTKVPFNPQKKTLLFVLQVGCRFCTSSAPVLREITQAAAQRGDVDILAVLPQDKSTSDEYLQGLGLRLPVIQANLSDLRVRGTPTAILCDGAGRVLSVWVGALDQKRGTDIMKSVAQMGGKK